jgi:hypothetical protein
VGVERLDDFESIDAWSPIASGEARLELARDAGPEGGAALRLDFDFRGGGGFAVARRTLRRAMPQSWAISFRLRGSAPPHRLELKLADASGRNVWWWHRDAFEFPRAWQSLRVPSREIEFAWGPAGGGSLRELGAIELALVVPGGAHGGAGRVWIADLALEDLDPKEPPRVERTDASIEIDFRGARDLGGVVVDWEPSAVARAFEVAVSEDGVTWQTAARVSDAGAARSWVPLPGTSARKLRVAWRADEKARVAAVEPLPFEVSRNPHELFHRIAAGERRGLHPRYWSREQAYWTPVGVEGAATCALLDEDGRVEVDSGSFTLEPFVWVDGALVTWADVATSQSLADGWLPIPSATWRRGGLTLTTQVSTSESSLEVRYQLETDAPQRVRLFAAIRPYQVTPPWQSFGALGGAARVATLEWRDGVARVNGEQCRVIPSTPPFGFGAATFHQGEVTTFLARGELPPHQAVRDAFERASGAFAWDVELTPGAAVEIGLTIPFGARAEYADAWQHWRSRLGAPALATPAREVADAARTATAHVLVVRDGPALQPGPRRYTRSWIRDAATMSAALLRFHCGDVVRDFLRWYAPHQAPDGRVPCCVDRNGADWLPEHDSHGEWIFTIAEHFRLTRDRALAAELWPSARKAVGAIEALRNERLGGEWDAEEKRDRRGLLPESASHEGYLAHPVHAYWDDFWALRGLADAAELARALGDDAEVRRCRALHDALHASLYASIETVIARRGLAYVPGSVEWADFDAAATATAISTTDAAARLPADALAYTFDEYLRGFRKRVRGEIDWNNYTPYEIRIVGALVRLGRRADALELVDFFLADRRPLAWNQWPEIAWRDPRSPGHLGDVPHTWIGAEWALAVLSLFAYERTTDGALVLGAGIPERWLDMEEPVGVADLPTWYGRLDYTLVRRSDGALELALAGGLEVPAAGIVIEPPLARPLASVEVDGAPFSRFDARSVTLDRSPATVVMKF